MAQAVHVTYREANRRYQRAFWLLRALYAVACLGGALLIKKVVGAEPLVVAGIAVATAAPIAGIFWLIGRLLRETDEYMRKLQTEALLSGGMITLSLVVMWSFFELYGVVPQQRYFPATMFVAPAFFVFYGISFAIRRLRAGDPACGPGA